MKDFTALLLGVPPLAIQIGIIEYGRHFREGVDNLHALPGGLAKLNVVQMGLTDLGDSSVEFFSGKTDQNSDTSMETGNGSPHLLPLSEVHNSADIAREIPHLMIRIRKVEQRTTGFRFRTNSDRRKRDLPHGCGLFGETDNHRIVVPLVPDIEGQLDAREDRKDEDGYPEETLEDGTLLLAQVPDAVNGRVVAVLVNDGLGRLEAAAVLDLLLGVHLVLAVVGYGLAERRRQAGHQGGPLPLVGGGQGRLG